MRAPVVVLADRLSLSSFFTCSLASRRMLRMPDAMVLGHVVQLLDELLAALFGQRRNRHADDLAVVARIQAEVGVADRLLDRADLRNVPGWIVIMNGSGTCRLPT